MASIVYMATNRLNGKRYVGATCKGLLARRKEHEYGPKAKRTTCRYFHAAIGKYGAENFDWSVLAEFDTFEDALRGEILLISQIKPEYNLTIGGQGSTGHKQTPEAIERHRAKMIGKKHSPEHNAKVAAARRGTHQSAECKAKIGAAHKGRVLSADHRRKLSEAHKGHKPSAETLKKMSQAMADWRPTAEHIEKVRVALKGRKRPPEVSEKRIATRRLSDPEYGTQAWVVLGISYRTWIRRRAKARIEAQNVSMAA